MSKVQTVSAIIVVLMLGIGSYEFIKGNFEEAPGETKAKEREVVIASVRELASERTSLPLIGTVTSLSEATIRAEGSGQITAVYHKLGDFVGAGGILAEIENSRERAALLSAEAQLASTEASAGISAISGGSQKNLLDEAKVSALNTLQSTFDTIDDSIRTKIDPMFVDPNLTNPKFSIQTTNDQLTININSERLKITEILKAQTLRRTTLAVTNDAKVEIEKTEEDLRYIKKFVDDVVAGLNQSVPNQSVSQATIDGYKSVVGGVRSSLNASLSSLSLTKDNLTAKQSQYDISLKQSGTGGNTTSDAALKQAQAGLRLAQVNLAKTIIRSPIAGTLNSFSLERGDFVTNFQEVAVVSNNGALEIRAYITEDDAREIEVGAKTAIDSKIEGIVTRVAPALDPLTKKIEVRIGIKGDAKTLVNGESVRVDIVRTAHIDAATSVITIPISALKITADGPVVFTVEEGTLVSHAIVEGALLGDRIEIREGLTPDMEIVIDARGLKGGASVTVKN